MLVVRGADLRLVTLARPEVIDMKGRGEPKKSKERKKGKSIKEKRAAKKEKRAAKGY